MADNNRQRRGQSAQLNPRGASTNWSYNPMNTPWQRVNFTDDSPWDSPDSSYSRYNKYTKFQGQLQADRKFTNKVMKKPEKSLGLGKMGWGFVGLDTVMNMKQGDDFGTAAAKGLASGMLWTAMPGIMTAHMIATTAPGVINGVSQWKRQKEQWWYKQHLPNFGGGYVDTRRAQTMRQAAVEAIQGSKMNARSALGGEARILSQAMYRGNA